MTCADEDFRWRDNPDVVVDEQSAVAVYPNAAGQAVRP